MINNIKQLDLNRRYTYADYLTWQFDEMVELIKGKIYHMSPAPSRYHQEVSGNLYGIIWTHLRKQACHVFSAPFDVRLPLPLKNQDEQKIDTVVQPDISVICDEKKLDDRGCNGAPDWIIEILSASTSSKDFNEKLALYQRAKVKEYWIVNPNNSTVFVYLLNDESTYTLSNQRPYVMGELVPVNIYTDFNIDTKEVFTGV